MTTTPNPTAEQVIEVAMQLAAMTLGQTVSGSLRKSDLAHYLLRNGPHAHNLLSEGAPSKEQVKAAHRAYYDANPEGGYLQAMRAALTASGAAPQKPQALAPEKVADVIHHAFPADSPYRCTHIINAPCVALATALCEAAKRGELT